jgi:hypothetical protein
LNRPDATGGRQRLSEGERGDLRAAAFAPLRLPVGLPRCRRMFVAIPVSSVVSAQRGPLFVRPLPNEAVVNSSVLRTKSLVALRVRRPASRQNGTASLSYHDRRNLNAQGSPKENLRLIAGEEVPATETVFSPGSGAMPLRQNQPKSAAIRVPTGPRRRQHPPRFGVPS